MQTREITDGWFGRGDPQSPDGPDVVDLTTCSVCGSEVGEPHVIDLHDLDELQQAYREVEDEA